MKILLKYYFFFCIIFIFLVQICNTTTVFADGAEFTCEPANDWTELFDRTEGWVAGDGIYSFNLEDADPAVKNGNKKIKIAFSFADSMIGNINADGSYKSDLVMVNHCFATLNFGSPYSAKPQLIFHYNTNSKGQPSNLFDRQYWLNDSIAINSVLYTTGMVVDAKTWTTEGIWLLTIPIRDGQLVFSEYKTKPVELIHRTNGYEVLFGIAVCAQGNDIYVYGFRDKTGEMFYKRQLLVAKTDRNHYGDIETWKFWTGKEWSSSIADCNTDAAALTHGISNELSVTKMVGGTYDGKFILVYTEGCIGEKLNFAVSDSPFTPFTGTTTFYNCPEPKLFDGEVKKKYGNKAHVITYNAKAHPLLSTSGELIVSYNLNTWGLNEGMIFADKKYCFPRFVRLKLK
ncbi:MAG: hypothetical protein LBE12_20220 [Planctomycetaceae bacterium]|jgi:hypothetical protein|nr:hypothetical protein [Planctomycetaceae bacterium]